MISLLFKVDLIPRQSAIIFDEVQEYPRARSLIKYLVQDGRFDYLETGSLMSIHKNTQDITLPSEEEVLKLKPLDFEEFLMAKGEERSIAYLKDAFNSLEPLPDMYHKKLNYLFREYLMVGGMPRVVQEYIDQNSFSAAEVIKEQILRLYEMDIVKHTDLLEERVRAMFEELPSVLSRGDKQFRPSVLDKSLRANKLENALLWLSSSQICNPCFNCTDPVASLGMSTDFAKYKLYMADTGLLMTRIAKDAGPYAHEVLADVFKGKLSLNHGALFENIVAQSLVANGYGLYFNRTYDKVQKKSYEIDFVIRRPFSDAANAMRISPIEVKSSTKFSTSSLNRFEAAYAGRIGMSYVVYPGALRKEDKRIYLPVYMAHLL